MKNTIIYCTKLYAVHTSVMIGSNTNEETRDVRLSVASEIGGSGRGLI